MGSRPGGAKIIDGLPFFTGAPFYHAVAQLLTVLDYRLDESILGIRICLKPTPWDDQHEGRCSSKRCCVGGAARAPHWQPRCAQIVRHPPQRLQGAPPPGTAGRIWFSRMPPGGPRAARPAVENGADGQLLRRPEAPALDAARWPHQGVKAHAPECFRIEDPPLGDAERLQARRAIDLVFAWRVMALYQARPRDPAESLHGVLNSGRLKNKRLLSFS
jgi:hypothetical protein